MMCLFSCSFKKIAGAIPPLPLLFKTSLCVVPVYVAVVYSVCFGGLLTRDDFEFDLFVNDRFHSLHNFFDSGRRTFNQDRNLHIIYVNPALTTYFGDHMRGVLELEGHFVIDIDRDDTDDLMEVRNAYLQAILPGHNWLSVLAGREYLSTMGGLIYDEASPVIRLDADLEGPLDLPFHFQVLVTEVENDSPYLHTRLKYRFSFFESLTFSYGLFRDTNNGIARIFNFIEQERVYTSRGRIQWFGLSLRKFIGDVFMRAAFIYNKGSVSLRHLDEGRRSMSMRGYLLDINFDYSVSDSVMLTAFLFLASGDNRPRKGTLRSFIAIDPYVDKTNIFFNGGIDSQFSSDNVGLNGVQLSGVIAPGLSVEWQINRKASLKCVLSYLFPHNGTGNQGSAYGWETDLMAQYNITDYLQIFGEFNVFKPGEYFRAITNRRDHLSVECMFGLNYFFSK